MPMVPEFSRLVPLARLSREPFRQQIEATPQERAGLARRFGLLALDRLAAAVELCRQDDKLILFDAEFEAEFEQECVVTLEPVRAALAQHFSLRYGPPEGEGREIVVASEDEAFEPLAGQAIDIGEAVAQELALALPVSPRLPDAELDGAAADESEDGPFASLRHLKER